MGKYSVLLRQDTHWLASNEFKKIITSWSGLEQWWKTRRPGDHAMGFVRYDKTIWFGITHRTTHLSQPFLSRKRADVRLEKITLPNKRVYTKIFNVTQQHLKLGDIYQVNLALPITATYSGSATDLFLDWYKKQPAPYAALIETPTWSVISNSPELGLQLEPQGTNYLATTKPMKGTLPRSLSKSLLIDSIKERAELDMIIDVHRNDLAQLAKIGSVKVLKRRQIMALKTLWQAHAVIQATIPKTSSPIESIQKIFPAGSVTGAPKLRAQQIIAQLEAQPRGVYCGAIGYIDWRGKSQFNVAIRTALLKNNRLTYCVGSGITLDAQIEPEYQELLSKAAVLY